MEIQKTSDGGVVIPFEPANRASRVLPLSDDEIMALRQLLRRAVAIIDICPVARRIVEEGNL